MNTPGVWVRFRYENGKWDHDPRWISMGRTMFFELRTKLSLAWRQRYGRTIPLGATPKAWVLSELDKMGVRVWGEDAIYLPYALYLKIQVSSEGDSKTGPRGQWQVYQSILPLTPKRPDEGLSGYRSMRDKKP